MSTPTDQSTECSQQSMGAPDTNNQAQNGRKSERPFFSTKYKQIFAYFLVALRNCSEETRDEFVDQLEEISMEEVDVEKECRNLDNIGDE